MKQETDEAVEVGNLEPRPEMFCPFSGKPCNLRLWTPLPESGQTSYLMCLDDPFYCNL